MKTVLSQSSMKTYSSVDGNIPDFQTTDEPAHVLKACKLGIYSSFIDRFFFLFLGNKYYV